MCPTFWGNFLNFYLEKEGREKKRKKTHDSIQGLLDLDGRNSQNYLHQTWAYF